MALPSSASASHCSGTTSSPLSGCFLTPLAPRVAPLGRETFSTLFSGDAPIYFWPFEHSSCLHPKQDPKSHSQGLTPSAFSPRFLVKSHCFVQTQGIRHCIEVQEYCMLSSAGFLFPFQTGSRNWCVELLCEGHFVYQEDAWSLYCSRTLSRD